MLNENLKLEVWAALLAQSREKIVVARASNRDPGYLYSVYEILCWIPEVKVCPSL